MVIFFEENLNMNRNFGYSKIAINMMVAMKKIWATLTGMAAASPATPIANQLLNTA